MTRVRKVIKPETTRAELGAIVCRVLEEAGDDPVLVGGGAVTIYTEGRYQSDDLDIVTHRDKGKLAQIMTRLGFEKRPMYWAHPDTKLLIQFLPPPAMVGKKYISPKVRKRLATAAGELPMVSPLDAACDRLAHYLNGDQQSMEQCVDVVVTTNVSLDAIRRWLASEDWSKDDQRAALMRLRRLVSMERERRRKRR